MTSGDGIAALVFALLAGVCLMRAFELVVLRKAINTNAAKDADDAEKAYEDAKRKYDANKQPPTGG